MTGRIKIRLLNWITCVGDRPKRASAASTLKFWVSGLNTWIGCCSEVPRQNTQPKFENKLLCGEGVVLLCWAVSRDCRFKVWARRTPTWLDFWEFRSLLNCLKKFLWNFPRLQAIERRAGLVGVHWSFGSGTVGTGSREPLQFSKNNKLHSIGRHQNKLFWNWLHTTDYFGSAASPVLEMVAKTSR